MQKIGELFPKTIHCKESELSTYFLSRMYVYTQERAILPNDQKGNDRISASVTASLILHKKNQAQPSKHFKTQELKNQFQLLPLSQQDPHLSQYQHHTPNIIQYLEQKLLQSSHDTGSGTGNGR
jgi:hypothetical protein